LRGMEQDVAENRQVTHQLAEQIAQVQLRLLLGPGLRRGSWRGQVGLAHFQAKGDWTVAEDRNLLAAHWSGATVHTIVVRKHDTMRDAKRRMNKIRAAFMPALARAVYKAAAQPRAVERAGADDCTLYSWIDWPRTLPPSPMKDLMLHMLVAPSEPEPTHVIEAALVRLRSAQMANLEHSQGEVTISWTASYLTQVMERAALTRLQSAASGYQWQHEHLHHHHHNHHSQLQPLPRAPSHLTSSYPVTHLWNFRGHCDRHEAANSVASPATLGEPLPVGAGTFCGCDYLERPLGATKSTGRASTSSATSSCSSTSTSNSSSPLGLRSSNPVAARSSSFIGRPLRSSSLGGASHGHSLHLEA